MRWIYVGNPMAHGFLNPPEGVWDPPMSRVKGSGFLGWMMKMWGPPLNVGLLVRPCFPQVMDAWNYMLVFYLVCHFLNSKKVIRKLFFIPTENTNILFRKEAYSRRWSGSGHPQSWPLHGCSIDLVEGVPTHSLTPKLMVFRYERYKVLRNFVCTLIWRLSPIFIWILLRLLCVHFSLVLSKRSNRQDSRI